MMSRVSLILFLLCLQRFICQLPTVTVQGQGTFPVFTADKNSVFIFPDLLRFVAKIPKWNPEDPGMLLTYPEGPNKGKYLIDTRSKKQYSEGTRGVVFYNQAEKTWQAVPADNTGMIMFNGSTENGRNNGLIPSQPMDFKQADILLKTLNGANPNNLKPYDIKKLLIIANKYSDLYGITDRHASELARLDNFHELDHKNPYLYAKVGNEQCYATIVKGTGVFEGLDGIEQRFDKDVFVVNCPKTGWRAVDPEDFYKTYRNANKNPITPKYVPQFVPLFHK